MSDGLVINSLPFQTALERLISTSKKSAVEVMKQQAKLLFREVALITPPGGGKKGETLKGKAAERAGKLAIVRDVNRIYGTPSKAYDDLAVKSKNIADAFWSAYKNNRTDDAAQIIKSNLGKSFVTFDAGRTARKLIGKPTQKKALFYISDPASMAAYIKQAQASVWFLASGWSKALRALGSTLPTGVGKHSAPGTLRVIATDKTIEIRMTNDVRYARQIKNLQAQINFAMKKREGALNRNWQEWMNRLSRTTSTR